VKAFYTMTGAEEEIEQASLLYLEVVKDFTRSAL
jgi:hypothetical protein